MSKYICYENNTPQKAMTKKKWKNYYNTYIDKIEYTNFANWWYDMTEKSKLIIRG